MSVNDLSIQASIFERVISSPCGAIDPYLLGSKKQNAKMWFINQNTYRKSWQERRRKQQVQKRLIWAGMLISAGGLIWLATWNSYRPPIGQSYPIMDSEHLPGEIRPPAYNSNPPTSGPHYDQGLDPGFYDESDLPDLPYFLEAAAVTNMEQGYIVFWYNCELLDENSCEELKDDIRFFISDSAYTKLVALPWDATDVPLVLTSWGYLLEMESFNGVGAIDFIHSNWMLAPEAAAP